MIRSVAEAQYPQTVKALTLIALTLRRNLLASRLDLRGQFRSLLQTHPELTRKPPLISRLLEMNGKLSMKTVATLFKLSVASLFISTLLGCDLSSSSPWNGFATNRETGKVEWWLSSYASHSECMKNMYWQVNNDANQKVYYKEPFGCGYMSNNFFDAVIRNELVGEKQNFECLAESKNPQAEKILAKYSPVLNQKDDRQCLANTDFDVVWVGRFSKQ